MFVREEIIDVKNLLISGGLWANFEGEKNSFLKKSFQYFRSGYLIFFHVMLILSVNKMGLDKSLGGLFIYIPVNSIILLQTQVFLLAERNVTDLLKSLENCLNHSLQKTGAKQNFNEHYKKSWLFLKYIEYSIHYIVFMYFVIPFVADILLKTFGYLERPVVLPFGIQFFESKIRTNLSIFQHFLNIIWVYCACFSSCSYIGFFIIVSAYSESIINIHHVSINENSNRIFPQMILSHQLILKLGKNLKATLGLAFALYSNLISICLCLCLFVVTNSNNSIVIIMYTYGFLYYLLLGYLFCYLGQKLENESSKIFSALHSTPWYTYSVEERKTMNMIIRQARQPLKIDFKGRTPMNLTTYRQILNTSYSYFMLLRSVTSKTQ